LPKLNGGYAGQLLRIDLTDEKCKKEPLDPAIARMYLGGKGLAAYMFFNEVKKSVVPLSSDNKLIFMTGPLCGSIGGVCASRFAVCTKSPLTGAWLDSSCGGFWGPELKFAGYDGVIVEGRSDKPVYIHIQDENVEIRSAEDLWGADTFQTMRLLQERHVSDRGVRVLSIGPAGEKRALLANIIADVRAAGRGGSGAVMGSKNLKAISVVGHKKIKTAENEKFKEAVADAIQKVKKDKITSNDLTYRGTANLVLGVNAAGGWPTHNFQTGVFEKAEEISGEAFRDHLWGGKPGQRPCWGCIIRCAHVTIIKEGKWAGIVDEGPDYETIWAYGPQCGVSSREMITVADYYSDAYGIDTISLGNTIGFLMECYEKGLISKEDTDGVDLRFGNAGAMVETVMRAGTVTGRLGELSANGVKRAAEKIGRESEKFAIHVKGLEIPAYDPRAMFGMGLSYARSDRGACHLRPWTVGKEVLGHQPPLDPFATQGKAPIVKANTDIIAIVDSMGMCQFMTFAIWDEEMHAMLNPLTGFNWTKEEFLKIGERINNLTRVFNLREGFLKEDDNLPWRILNEPSPEGPCKGLTVPLEPMLAEYYRLCGWDAEGRPKKEKLQELGLDFAAKVLYA